MRSVSSGRPWRSPQREGDSTIERRALANAAFVDAFHLRWHDSRTRGSRAIELARAEGDPSTEIQARRAVILVSTATGEREQARSHLAPALDAGRAAARAMVGDVDEL